MKNLSSNDQIFYADGYRLGMNYSEKGFSTQKLFQGISQMYESVDQLIESLEKLAARQNFPVECHKGCHWCCHQAVYANSYELHYLTSYIRRHFSEEKQEHILAKATEKNRQTSSMSESSVLHFKSPCPLLENGCCSAYEARPMACRIYLSTRVSTCLEFFKDPENPDNYPALLDFPLQAGRMMNEGFMAALKTKNIETAEFRLEEGLQIALTGNQLENLP